MPADVSSIGFSGGRGRASGTLGVTFTGFSQVLSALDSRGPVFARVQEAVKEEMTLAAEAVLGEAMQLAPLDEGTLRASGYAQVYVNGKRVSGQHTQAVNVGTGKTIGNAGLPKAAEKGIQVIHQVAAPSPTVEALGNQVEALVGFNQPYALEQHERLDFHHPKGGEAKYLEKPVKQMSGKILTNLQGAVARAL